MQLLHENGWKNLLQNVSLHASDHKIMHLGDVLKF